MKNNPNVVQRSRGGDYKEISLQEIAALPLAQWLDLSGELVNVQSAMYYDSAYIIAGTAVTPSARKALFSRGKSQADTIMNSGAAIASKGEFMTNMITDGEFEGGTTFILERIAIDVVLTSELPTTLGGRGEITAPNYTASVVISAANNFRCYTEQIEAQWVRNENIIKRAPIRFWPSPVGYSGAFGSPNSGFIQNGPGNDRYSAGLLDRPVVLNSEDRFNVVLQPLVDTFTPTIGAVIRACLYGKVVKSASGYLG